MRMQLDDTAGKLKQLYNGGCYTTPLNTFHKFKLKFMHLPW